MMPNRILVAIVAGTLLAGTADATTYAFTDTWRAEDGLQRALASSDRGGTDAVMAGFPADVAGSTIKDTCRPDGKAGFMSWASALGILEGEELAQYLKQDLSALQQQGSELFDRHNLNSQTSAILWRNLDGAWLSTYTIFAGDRIQQGRFLQPALILPLLGAAGVFAAVACLHEVRKHRTATRARRLRPPLT